MECNLGWEASLHATTPKAPRLPLLLPVVLDGVPTEALIDSGSSILWSKLGAWAQNGRCWDPL